MDFIQADDRYRELREQLAAGKLNPGEYEKGAAQLRVLGADGAWWAIHPRNGKWLRWDGKAWQPAEPPHLQAQQAAVPANQTTVMLDEKPPIGVILKGEEALEQLLEIRRICEEISPEGIRYVPVDLKPGGLLRGIAYTLEPDGSLNPKIAILYAAADAAEGKKVYIGGHWVIVPSEAEIECQKEPPTEKQQFAALVREMIDNLEIGYELRERIKHNLDLNQINVDETVKFPEQPNGWWRAHIVATGVASQEFLKSVGRLSSSLHTEAKTEPKRKLLEDIIVLCERGLVQIGENEDPPVVAGIHTALAAAWVELGSMESDLKRRADRIHIAEDHAEIVEWITREGVSNQATVETIAWLVAVRQAASSLVSGVQALALRCRLERSEQFLALVSESYLAKKKQARRDLFAAQALEAGSHLVENPDEQHKVLAVALWQAQAALQLALKIGEASLVAQCQDTLMRVEAELNPLRGEYA